jgi:hypothetical protein
MTIRIEYLKIHEPSAPPVPVEVAIDQEPTGDVAILEPIEDAAIPSLGGIGRLTSTYPKQPYVKHEATFDVTEPALSDYWTQERHLYPTNYGISLPQVPKNAFRERIYPLRIQLSSDLRSRRLVADGSSLFREKSASDVVSKLRLFPTPLSIDYKVHVSGKTGRVIQWSRTQVLLDKRLQELADHIVYSLRFGRMQEKNTKGIIRITFECPGSEVDSYLVESDAGGGRYD